VAYADARRWRTAWQSGPVNPDRLLGDTALDASSVVANCAMNRERGLAGVNSYARELGFNPLDRLVERIRAGTGRVAWLDLCCGAGRALGEGARALAVVGLGGRARLVGVDLVEAPAVAGVRLVGASVATWRPAPEERFDLVTCVHGLHYVGDKLGLLARAAGWLTGDGLLVADLDLASVRLTGGAPGGRRLVADVRRAGFGYDTRRRRITLAGRREVSLPYAYLGADDRAGPNYTGQPAVDSYYERVEGARPGRNGRTTT
jgi:SAM-dependent methyltransferase